MNHTKQLIYGLITMAKYQFKLQTTSEFATLEEAQAFVKLLAERGFVEKELVDQICNGVRTSVKDKQFPLKVYELTKIPTADEYFESLSEDSSHVIGEGFGD